MTGTERAGATNDSAAAMPAAMARANALKVLNPSQGGREASPWSVRSRIGVALWHIVWLTLFLPTPKPLGGWRRFLLRQFGCRIEGKPFIASSAVIKMPWQLTIEDRAAVGPGAEIYNLAPIRLRRRCTVAQQVYLCAGTHDMADPMLPLVVGEIEIGEEAFIGVRALILPGVTVNAGAVVGGGAVVAKDVAAWTIVAGNPAKFIKKRTFAAPAAEAGGQAAPAVPPLPAASR